jgi:hypothetical protein
MISHFAFAAAVIHTLTFHQLPAAQPTDEPTYVLDEGGLLTVSGASFALISPPPLSVEDGMLLAGGPTAWADPDSGEISWRLEAGVTYDFVAFYGQENADGWPLAEVAFTVTYEFSRRDQIRTAVRDQYAALQSYHEANDRMLALQPTFQELVDAVQNSLP